MMGRLKGLLGAAAVKARQRGGQMTVELATVLPVALAIMAIVCNGMVFFSECAAFDRVARNAVRLYATVPTGRRRRKPKRTFSTCCSSDSRRRTKRWR